MPYKDPAMKRKNNDDWRAANPTYMKQYHAHYTDRSYIFYVKNHPDHFKARRKLNYAIKKGTIIRPSVCSTCPFKGMIEAHHSDYSKPYDVTWLCRMCHLKHEKKLKTPLN